MQCRELDVFFEQEGLAPLSAAARQHLSECPACKHFFDDVTAIIAVAHQLPAEVEPPAQIWISIRTELIHEGTIRGFSREREAAPWWQSFAELFRNRGWATAAVAMVVILVFILQNQQSVQVTFLMFSGHLPLAVALLFALILGAVIVVAFGAARILQLRMVAGRARRKGPSSLPQAD